MSALGRWWRHLVHGPQEPAHRPGPLALTAELGDYLLAQADACDFFPCPAEQRRRPHAIHADGSRDCWSCGHTTTPGVERS
ncbi:hypothetical protein [Streptomyces sp. NBC_01233]|uniref:hypothetical protein n=1 Tax=Streptomyces sp. NBC_01233 TaxID=2903787 RepID=UPI002E119C59|nr:hypothetical protein OG332_24340 [Streptomyces sp. NBC_01233]